MRIEDRTDIVLEVRKVLTKRNLMLQLENKCQNLEAQIKKFHRKFTLLWKKGLPSLRDSSGQLIPLENQQHKLHEVATNKTKFSKFKGIITGKTFIEGLEYGLFIQHEIQQFFIIRPIFENYIDVDKAYRKVTKFSILNDK